jgi:RNA polymerase sigma-70 factor (ECF subfamily)
LALTGTVEGEAMTRPEPRDFATTQWSLVAAARPGETSDPRARAALEELCRIYWFPLYAFVRRHGHGSDDAQDLTQAFFSGIAASGGFVSADPERGRFRSYLLGAMKHVLANERQRAKTLKRGGAVRFVELDALDLEARYARTATEPNDPEWLFDRQWAEQTVSTALRSLRHEMSAAGKGGQFEALKGCLTGEGELPRVEIAARLKINEGAVKVAVHRLRRRYRDLLRAAIAETVSSSADLDDEMRYLLEVLRRR